MSQLAFRTLLLLLLGTAASRLTAGKPAAVSLETRERLHSTSSAVISAAACHRHQTWGGGYEKSDVH